MPHLSSHPNVYSSAIALLDIKGWTIKIDPGAYELEDSRLNNYEATRDGIVVYAPNPLELLALAAIHEYHHPHSKEPYWWCICGKDPDLLERLEDEALERSFLNYLEREEQEALKIVKNAIDASNKDPDTSPEDRIGISKSTLLDLIGRFPKLRD